MSYLAVAMPDWFVLEVQQPDGSWMDLAFCTPQDFSREPDGSYLRSDGGSGLWLRVVDIDADGVIDHADGSGKHWRCRLVPLPDPRYPGLTVGDHPSIDRLDGPLGHYRFVPTEATDELPAGFSVFYDSPQPPHESIEVGWAPDYWGAVDVAEVIEDHRGNL